MSPSGETFPMREGARDAKRRGRKGAKNDKRKMKNEKCQIEKGRRSRQCSGNVGDAENSCQINRFLFYCWG